MDKVKVIFRRTPSGDEVDMPYPSTNGTLSSDDGGSSCSPPEPESENDPQNFQHVITCYSDGTCVGATPGIKAVLKLSDSKDELKEGENRYPSIVRGIGDLFSSVKPVTKFSFWFGNIEDKNIDNILSENNESVSSSLGEDEVDGAGPRRFEFDDQVPSISRNRNIGVQTDPAIFLSCVTQENVREGYSYWKVVTVMLPALFTSMFYTLDVGTDIKLAVVYFRGGNVWWGSICSFFILMPSLFINIWLYQRLVSQGDTRKWLPIVAILQMTPLYVKVRKLINCYKALHCPENLELTVKTWKEVEGDCLPTEASGLESTYESKFQLHLQMYVLLKTMSSEEEWLGLVSVLLSLCSMSLGKAGVARNIKGKIILMLTWTFMIGSHVVVKSALATEHWGLWFLSYGISICFIYTAQLLENKCSIHKMFISRFFKNELGILWTSVALNNEVDLNKQIGSSFIYLMFAIWFISQDSSDAFRIGVLLTAIIGPLLGFMFAQLYNRVARKYMSRIQREMKIESPSYFVC
ncbi:uncharacterized protein LOC143036827 [Oratosquilla oratoria]|uniref:uncharacterized protein LOC143036827 n=1 Tax=Oratosquilla oratoria TaxID=337810 RepID=UPI003F7782F1